MAGLLKRYGHDININKLDCKELNDNYINYSNLYYTKSLLGVAGSVRIWATAR
jgi:hypothetical protein